MSDQKIPFPKFAVRLGKACDNHPNCPALHKGRQVWLKSQLAGQGLIVSVEGIRKWLAGETRPREETAEKLGRVLGVDPHYLRTGQTAGSTSADADAPVASAPPLQIGIRPGLSVEIRGLPLDLTKVEASKLANVILAHASAE